MVGFKTVLLKFDQQGEKTGWTYILIPAKIAGKIKPNNKKSFRVKGKIDEVSIKSVALLPMGSGDFIIPVNAGMRKAIKKMKGASIVIELEEDKDEIALSPALMDCLADDPLARSYFETLPVSHKHYYSKWIETAKTETTKVNRIATCMHAFSHKLSFSQMMQLHKKKS